MADERLVPAVAAAGLVPWTAGIAARLPQTAVARHWNLAWAGLDLAIIAGLALTSWLARRRDERVGPAATATATLMCADAWFDVCTAAAGAPLAASVTEAALELAVAGICLAVGMRHRPAPGPGAAARRRTPLPPRVWPGPTRRCLARPGVTPGAGSVGDSVRGEPAGSSKQL
jgi:LPXTG-motif cell wall-anchored protein